MKGWIKMFRKISDWELYQDVGATKIFLDILIRAAYEDYVTKDGFTIHAGYVFTTVKELSEKNGMSVRQVRTALEKLTATNTLTTTATNKGTLIKVEKWAFFQGEREKATSTLTSTATNYNNNKNNKINNNNIYVMPKKKKNSFLNYEQRDYDLNYIEQLAAEKNKRENLTAEDLEKIQKAID